MSWFSKALKSVSKVALPVIGNALLPGAGGVIGGALAGAVGNGKPSLKSVGTGALLGGLTSGVAGGAAKAGGAGNLLKSVGGWAKDNPELLLGGISAIQGAQQQSKANKLQQQALDLAAQPWQETSALRAQALKSLMEPQQTDLSNIYSGSSNPFMRSLRG